MQVTMVELNKNANSIINQAYNSGEPITILKHGKPIARILPIHDNTPVEDALNYLAGIEPLDVDDCVASVINKAQQHGF